MTFVGVLLLGGLLLSSLGPVKKTESEKASTLTQLTYENSNSASAGAQIYENESQPKLLTYVSESAGTSNEPEQATKQNNEPVLAAEGKEVPHITKNMVYNCNDACHQVVVLNGIDSAEAICGVFGDYDPFSITYAYEKCARPEAVEGVTAEANKIVNDATAEFEAQWSPQEPQQNSCDVHVVVDMIHSRAKEHGLDLSPFWSADKITGSRPRVDWLLEYYGRDLEHALFNVKRVVDRGSDDWMDRHSCEWLTQVGADCSCMAGPRCNALPFCEANEDFPGCEQLLDIYGNCERILADATSKSEL